MYSSFNGPASYPGPSLAAAPFPSMHSVNSVASSTYPYAPTRQSYPSGYHHPFPDDMFQTYSLHQSPQFQQASNGLPSLEYMTPGQWSAVAPEVRQPRPNFALDQDTPSRYGSINYPQPNIPASAETTAAAERRRFPAMTPLGSQLPPLSQAVPVQENRRSSVSQNLNDSSGAMGVAASEDPQSLSYNPGTVPYDPDGQISEVSEPSQTSTSSTMACTGPNGIHQSSPPQSNGKAIPLGFQKVPPSPSRRRSYYASSNITSLPVTEDSEDSRCVGRLSKGQNHKLGYSSADSSGYGYSFGSNARNGSTNGSINPGGKLVSGEQYRSLNEPSHSRSYENFSSHSVNRTSSQALQRTSISSISNNPRSF